MAHLSTSVDRDRRSCLATFGYGFRKTRNGVGRDSKLGYLFLPCPSRGGRGKVFTGPATFGVPAVAQKY